MSTMEEIDANKPVAWLITDKNINFLQVESIQRLIDRAKHAHMTDIKLRINGKDEWYEADWIKHMKRADAVSAPVRLDKEKIEDLIWGGFENPRDFARAVEAAVLRANGLNVDY